MPDDAANAVIAFDIGGSHVSAARCCRDGFRLGRVFETAYEDTDTPEAFVGLLDQLSLRCVESGGRVDGAALAFPGPFDFDAGISRMRHKLSYIYGINLRMELSRRLGLDPQSVRFLHDAKAFLLGEICAGAGRAAGRVAGLTLGTGIGSAFAVNGAVVTEGPGVPPGGEIWNLPFRGGIVEDAVSSRAIRRAYEVRTGKSLEVIDLTKMAREDAAAAESFAEFGRHLGEAMREHLAGFAPQIVVLGGGISRSAEQFVRYTEAKLTGSHIEVRISELLDTAALVGAAAAWFNKTRILATRRISIETLPHINAS